MPTMPTVVTAMRSITVLRSITLFIVSVLYTNNKKAPNIEANLVDRLNLHDRVYACKLRENLAILLAACPDVFWFVAVAGGLELVV